jgi:regulator of RNase E activity RraA
MGGGTKLFRLQEHGLAGVITDGRLRDFEELAGYDFAAYCSGEATRWGGDVVTPFQVNVPVVVGGVGMLPGQYIYADAAGAVVFPEGEVDEVLDEARKIAAEDKGYRARIAGETISRPSTGASA